MAFFKVFEKNHCSSYNNNTLPRAPVGKSFLVTVTKQKSA